MWKKISTPLVMLNLLLILDFLPSKIVSGVLCLRGLIRNSQFERHLEALQFPEEDAVFEMLLQQWVASSGIICKSVRPAPGKSQVLVNKNGCFSRKRGRLVGSHC